MRIADCGRIVHRRLWIADWQRPQVPRIRNPHSAFCNPSALRNPQSTIACLLAFLPACLLLPAAGCVDQEVLKLRRENTMLKEAVEAKDHKLAAQQAAIQELHKRLAEATAITEEDLKKIFYPERLVIDTLSGGYNDDGQPGDDGVVVYLKPVDRDGDTLKVVGDIRIELYDLASPPGENRIGVYEVRADDVHQLWYGKFLTYHYTVKCPWQSGPPRHRELTIRAMFVDYLTQRVITAQTTCNVNLAP